MAGSSRACGPVRQPAVRVRVPRAQTHVTAAVARLDICATNKRRRPCGGRVTQPCLALNANGKSRSARRAFAKVPRERRFVVLVISVVG